MGVPNIFKSCKFNEVDLDSYPYKKVAIDMYVILHKYAVDVQIAKQLVDDPCAFIEEYYENIRFYLNSFVQKGFEPYLVYDGNKMNFKVTEEDRAQNRLKAFLQQNWVSAVEIVPEQMFNFHHYLKLHPIHKDEKPLDIPYIVAPFEADAQLTYLVKTGKVQSVLTNDSDLIVYGVKHILMIRQNNLFRYDMEEPEKDEKVTVVNQIDRRKLWLFGYLIGCDYFKGIPKIGIVKAFKIIETLPLIEDGTQVDWEATYKKLLEIPEYAKAIKTSDKVGIDYKKYYDRVRIVYWTQPVIDPENYQLKYLNGTEVPETKLNDFGHVWSPKKVGTGEINPINGLQYKI